MPNEQIQDTSEPLETATELDRAGIIRKGTAYKLAKNGIIPCYLVGPKQTGVRFRRSEVLTALRRPAQAGNK
jgi:hypothetical protein